MSICQGPNCRYGRRARPLTEDRVSIDLTGLCRCHLDQQRAGQPLTRLCDRCARTVPDDGQDVCDACQARLCDPWGEATS